MEKASKKTDRMSPDSAHALQSPKSPKARATLAATKTISGLLIFFKKSALKFNIKSYNREKIKIQAPSSHVDHRLFLLFIHSSDRIIEVIATHQAINVSI